MTGRRGPGLATLLAAIGLGAMASAQAPPPPPEEDILDEINSPESQADRDVERLGPEKARAGATQRLKDALDQVAGGKGMRMPVIGIDQVVKCDDPRVEDLEDALRYYARAHGLPTGLDALRDAVETAQAVGGSDVGVRGAAGQAALEQQLGKGLWDMLYTLDALRRLKAAARPCPEPDRKVSSTGRAGGLGKPAYVAGAAGVLALGALALSAGGDDTTTPDNSPPRVDLTSSYGNYAGNLTVTGSTGCARPGSSTPVAIALSGNPDGSNFVLNKGGLPFPGTLRADRSFDAEYVGPLSGFAGLPNNSAVRWRLMGSVSGTQLAATGVMNVTSGPCAQNDVMTSVTATKN